MAELREGDYVRQIIDYFEKNIERGYNPEDLKIALERQGYSRISINKAIEVLNAKKPKARQIKPEIVRIMDEPEQPKKKKGILSWLFGKKE